MIECILAAKKWPKNLPKITERSVAVSVAQLLVKAEYFHRSEKVEAKKGYLVVSINYIYSVYIFICIISGFSISVYILVFPKKLFRRDRLLYMDVCRKYGLVEYGHWNCHCPCCWVYTSSCMA